MVVDKKTAGYIVIVFVVALAAGYFISSSIKSQEISEKNKEILELQQKLKEIESSVKTKGAEVVPSETASAAGISTGGEINCLLCHDLKQTKSFHLPQIIMKIDEKKGKRRRVCIDCHGPNAYDEQGNFLGWSAEKQMTPLNMITFNESIGINGVFEFPNKVPHMIHKRKLDKGVVKCETCHVVNGEFIVPKADVNKGEVLVCQNCKYHPEEGNYITIHVELAGMKCTTCHLGDLVAIHREKTFELGKV